MKRTDARVTAKQLGWDYPFSQLELMAADNIDLQVMVNSDSKSGFKPYRRPFKVDVPNGENVIAGTVMSLEEARIAYKVVKTTKTDEEIRALNEEFKRKLKEKDNA